MTQHHRHTASYLNGISLTIHIGQSKLVWYIYPQDPKYNDDNHHVYNHNAYKNKLLSFMANRHKYIWSHWLTNIYHTRNRNKYRLKNMYTTLMLITIIYQYACMPNIQYLYDDILLPQSLVLQPCSNDLHLLLYLNKISSS